MGEHLIAVYLNISTFTAITQSRSKITDNGNHIHNTVKINTIKSE